MVSLTVYDRANGIGGNKLYLEDKEGSLPGFRQKLREIWRSTRNFLTHERIFACDLLSHLYSLKQGRL